MSTQTTDRIEKQIELNAPVSRVWRALTDHLEFGQWFGMNFQSAFVAERSVRGQITIPGYEHVILDMEIVAMEPEGYFSYRWHPYAVDPKVDYTKETPTLVEFRLEPIPGGTRLRVCESGFDSIPAHRRDEAFRMNTGGWEGQLDNIANHVNPAS